METAREWVRHAQQSQAYFTEMLSPKILVGLDS